MISTIPVGNAKPGINPPKPGFVVNKKSTAVQVCVWFPEHSSVSFTLMREFFFKITSTERIIIMK